MMQYKSDNELIFEQYNKNIAHILNEHTFELHPNSRSMLKFSIDYDNVNKPTRKYAELLEHSPDKVNKYLSDNFKYIICMQTPPSFGGVSLDGGFTALHNTLEYTNSYNFITSLFENKYVSMQMTRPDPIVSLDLTDESGVMLSDDEYFVWWVNDTNIICEHLYDLLLKYCNWDIDNSTNLSDTKYNTYKSEIYGDLQKIGIPYSKITISLYGNMHRKHGISDDDFAELFG